ncbi:hypothetical protein [Labedella populi]|uniref:hypothetical protein n=1 Tax=Labedella populi TaxID=2498850 RepID=UPI000FFB5EBB|nr:hypothetical protein [Labedella populi]
MIAAAAGCAAEILSLAFAGAKFIAMVTKATKILNGLKAAKKFYNQLGGTMTKVIDKLKKYVKKKSSLKKKEIDALEGLFRAGGKILINAIGIGTCWSLVTASY